VYYFNSVLLNKLVPLVTYSASNIGLTLKSGLGVVKGHLKWQHTSFYLFSIVTMTVSFSK